jgi:hypothetical protein
MQATPARGAGVVAGGAPHPYVAPQSGGAEANCDDDPRQVCARHGHRGGGARIGRLRRPARNRIAAGERDGVPPRGLRAQARANAGQFRGRRARVILYDFSGNACEGYVLQFRQVSELDNGEGKVTLSDLRSTTWEDGAAKKFIFKSQNYLNETLLDSVDGEAERQRDKVAVTLKEPAAKTFDLEAGMVFPTDHMRRIIAAAREGKNILELPVYDGSEKGEKVYDTLTVIGAEIAPDGRVPNDAAAGQQALAGLKRWPVTVSYFDKTARSGDQAPVYAIKFEVYENGVSRALMLDYNDFAISGELIAIELRDTAPCK